MEVDVATEDVAGAEEDLEGVEVVADEVMRWAWILSLLSLCQDMVEARLTVRYPEPG